MKTKFLLSIGLIAGFSAGFAQSPYTFHNLEFPFQKCSTSAVDVDGDGDHDILITGEGEGIASGLFINNGNFSFSPTPSGVMPLALATASWGDVNNDGQPDLFINGFSDTPFSKLYTNNNGTFTEVTSPAASPLAPGSSIGDVNNDGYDDIILFGNHNIGNGQPRLYLSDGNGGYTESNPFAEALLIDPELSVVDYDNDGDLDIFLMAGYEQNSDARYVRMYRNDGDGNFTTLEVDVIAKGFGSATWGDYDGDGDLDLLINGDGFVNSGEDTDVIFRLYNNNDGVFTEATIFAPYRQASLGQGGRFVDWDNDGDLDVIVAGWNPVEVRQAVAIFLNDGNGNYTEADNNEFIPGVSEHSIEIADFDGDTAPDLVISGFSNHDYDGPGSAFISNVTYVLENPTTAVNAAPSAPTNLQATTSGSSVTFSWDASTDDNTPQASLSYNLYVKEANGDFIMTPLADVNTGFLKRKQLGNVQLNTSWTLNNLPAGYTWGVQSIDNGYRGSGFSSPTVNTNDLFDSNLLSVYPNPSADDFSISATDGPYTVRIYTVEGKLVKSFNLFQNFAQFELEPGVYILQAENEKGEMGTKKLIAQ